MHYLSKGIKLIRILLHQIANPLIFCWQHIHKLDSCYLIAYLKRGISRIIKLYRKLVCTIEQKAHNVWPGIMTSGINNHLHYVSQVQIISQNKPFLIWHRDTGSAANLLDLFWIKTVSSWNMLRMNCQLINSLHLTKMHEIRNYVYFRYVMGIFKEHRSLRKFTRKNYESTGQGVEIHRDRR